MTIHSHTVPTRWTRSEARTIDGAPDCDRIEGVRADLLATAPDGPLGHAARHHLSTPGKMARARLCLAACEVLDVEDRVARDLALACELLHNASLVHDDVQDRDLMRRGQPTVWRVFGEAAAINLGDYLLTSAIDVVLGCDLPAGAQREIAQAFTRSTLTLIRGQAGDTSGSVATLKHHEEVAQAKTGPLLALPVESALVAAGAAASGRARVRHAFGLIGVAYQIKDDLLDLRGGKGRRPGTDLREGRPNAPLLYYATANPDDRLAATAITRPLDDDEVAALRQRILESAAPGACEQRIQELRGQAARVLDELPPRIGAVTRQAMARLIPLSTADTPAALPATLSHTDRAGDAPALGGAR